MARFETDLSFVAFFTLNTMEKNVKVSISLDKSASFEFLVEQREGM